MGCAVGTPSAAGRLREAQRQVDELKQKLKDSEREKDDLRRRLEPCMVAADTTPLAGEDVLPEGETADAPKADTPKADVPKADPPKAAATKAATPEASSIDGDAAADAVDADADEATDTFEWEETEAAILPGVVAWEAVPKDTEAEGPTPAPPAKEASGKLSSSVDSSASTCAPTSALQAIMVCHQCGCEGAELFLDPSDMNRYCDQCWIEYYEQPPARCEVQPLVEVEVAEFWHEDRLAQIWSDQMLPGWPPPQMLATSPGSARNEGEVWSNISVRVRRDIVGPHAREHCNGEHLLPGEVLAGKYRVRNVVGEGHFTKAFLADDVANGVPVCLKRHRQLSVEALADLMVIGRRIEEADRGGQLFPRLIDAFYDLVGFTVESLIEGRNCLSIAQSDPSFFTDLGHLRSVAHGALSGLVCLERAGVVHNDVKPDNLIWVMPARSSTEQPPPGYSVKIVDFGCARLDQREELGRNWSLAEGGAGHLGKWSPEMTLRLPITHRSDVWGTAVSLCELYSGRCVWRNEADTAEVVLAQSLGLCGLRDGLPPSLLRRSPLDIRLLYTPAPRHLPLRRNALGQLEALRPTQWGLEQVLGKNWQEAGKGDLHEFLQTALIIDPHYRPSAAQLLECTQLVAPCEDLPLEDT